jgi:septum site-determining protein MinD
MDMVKRGDMLSTDDVLDILAIPLIGVVPEDEGILVSTNRGSPAAMDDRSRAGQAYRDIARRLRGEEVPFVPLDDNKGFFQKLAARFARTGG